MNFLNNKNISDDNQEKIILHCDLNNFFASVEIAKNPTLKDKILVVGGDIKKRKGIVLAKNEKAKEFGIKTGEPLTQALRKCPKITCVPPNLSSYHEYSKLVKNIYLQYTDLVEPFGIDECWLDVTGSTFLFGCGEKIAYEIKERVKKETNLTISVGVSFNKTFAKLGSDLKKPDAVTIISKKNFKKIIYPLGVDLLLMVGGKTFDILKRSGILTIGDLANANPIFLKSILGKNGEVLIRNAKGLDNSVVNPIKEKPKSISISRTQPEDLKNNDEIKKLVLEYCVDISKQLRQNKLKCSGVGILIKDSDFKSFDAQKKLDFFTNTTDDIYNCAYALFLKNYLWKKLVRSVGIKVYDLVDQSVCVQMDFFQTAPARIKKENLEKCVDEISYKYGNNTLKRGSLL